MVDNDNMGFQKKGIKILEHEQATSVNVSKTFENWLMKGVEPEDRVLIYFSGHGSQVPDENKTRTEDALLIGDLATLCIRCHMKTPRQDFHAKHLRKPSDDVLSHIKQMEDQHDIILPLNEEGMITCATCHNPHEKGVIPDIRAGAKGAGEKLRHRLANHSSMCIKCHAMR